MQALLFFSLLKKYHKGDFAGHCPISPDKPNMCYWVKSRGNLEDLCAPLVARLRHQRTAISRVIIYYKKCEDCASIYYFFHSSLRNECTDPISVLNFSRLVDMYTGVIHKDIQDSIIASFCDPLSWWQL